MKGKEITTLSQALDSLASRLPNHPWLGSKVSKAKDAEGKPIWSYEWMTVQEVVNTAKKFGAGLDAMGLTPEVEGEGKQWKMLGIQSKNRVEWNLCHMGNYLSGGTTIALYDTLGQDAARFVCHQTQLSTICCSKDLIAGIIKLKADDPEGQMADLANIVSFESDVAPNDLSAAEAQNIKVTTFDEVVSAGASNSSW